MSSVSDCLLPAVDSLCVCKRPPSLPCPKREGSNRSGASSDWDSGSQCVVVIRIRQVPDVSLVELNEQFQRE